MVSTRSMKNMHSFSPKRVYELLINAALIRNDQIKKYSCTVLDSYELNSWIHCIEMDFTK